MRITFFSGFNERTTPLFSKTKNFKFIDFIQMENCIFVNKSVSGSLYPSLSQVYLFAKDHDNCKTKFAANGLLKIPINNTSINVTKKIETSIKTSCNFLNQILLV